MEQTNPSFLVKKYRSILGSAIVVEAVSFLVTLTDALIAGNLVSDEAMAAIGLASPLLFAVTFIVSVINSGTMINYLKCVGEFEKRRANEFYSQGILLCLALGGLMALGLVFARDGFVACMGVSGAMARDFCDYYDIIIFFFMMEPLCCLLDNLIVADGGEKLSAVSNIVQIVANIALSLWMALRWGVWGIAMASVLCKALFIVVICGWFLNPNRGLRFLWYWSMSDCALIIRSGFVKGAAFAMTAFMTVAVNAYAVSRFGEDIMVTLTVVEKLLSTSILFLGLALSVQPLVGTLCGEKNYKGIRYLMATAFKDMLAAGLLFSALSVIFAPWVTKAFGVNGGESYAQCVEAVRLVGATLFCQAILVLIFVYHFQMRRNGLSFFISLCKELVCPLGVTFLAVYVMDDPSGLWTGLALSYPVALVIVGLTIYLRYGRERFPFLLPKEDDDATLIYDFVAGPETAVSLSKKAINDLEARGYPKDTASLVGAILEDAVMLIWERNREAEKPTRVECTIISESPGIRLILRDSGVIFDFTDEDSPIDSFRQFFLAYLVSLSSYKGQITTTGYSRHIVVMPRDAGQRDESPAPKSDK